MQLQPAAAPSTPGIPRALATPSAWMPGTAAAGPLGPLAVIGLAQRRVNWFQAPQRLFGVSATTGTYRFLDLPDQATDSLYGSTVDAALSPDGRHVGYWITGSVPHPVAGEGAPVVGFASYDTTTGRVVRHVFPSSHGLGPNSMMWVSDSVLMVDFGVADKELGSSSHDRAFLWTPSTGSTVDVPGGSFLTRLRLADIGIWTPAGPASCGAVRPSQAS